MTVAADHRGPHAPLDPLARLLRERFGFAAFRPFQEPACRAAFEGRDVLLVMPTGAGKSLCYQLPGVARGGTTLLVSPLIALMEDQVAKLARQGFRAERVHSGRERAASRAACRAYLDGGLDFLFVAPERLSVPGFPEMLARRKPALIAVDEAHCISQWGHDFRPDYRLLGERLPLLRPAPVIAVTATATPRVQDDIVAQLGIEGGARFIHGFRRTNIAIEAIEIPPGARGEVARRLLADAGRRPAIVYAPTRKETERLAAELAEDFGAAAYHAGLPPAERDRVQAAFLAGELEVVCATIAFGMGIDKPDVRTVVHTALPGSIEAYYQELGRAGRDGRPARAVLLWSYADRRTHEFFLARDYPPAADLARMFEALPQGGAPLAPDALARAAALDPEMFETALEKLWLHGGALVAPDGGVARGRPDWRATYEAQRAHRAAQVEAMLRYAQARGCRMGRLVRHFGDQSDAGEPCGMCDGCAPGARATAVPMRAPDARETAALRRIVRALEARDGQPTGRLHRETVEEAGFDRRAFEVLLDGLAAAGLVRLEPDAFERDGQAVEFERAYLAGEARALEDVRLIGSPPARGRRSGRDRKEAAARPPDAGLAPDPAIVEALRAWRLEEARRRRIPAFRILSDRALHALAAARPRDAAALLAVHGIGPKIAEKYGAALIEIAGRGP